MVFAGCIICAVLAVSGAWAAETKIAVVDMSRVMKEYSETKSAEALLQKQIEEIEAEQKEMMGERDKLRKDFESARESAKDKALSDKERESKMDVAEMRLNALRDCEIKIRDTVNQRQKQIADQKMRMQRRIVSKLREIVSKYAANKHISLVMDSAGISISGVEAVVYNEAGLDITEEILKIVNTGTEEKKSEKSEDKK
jgi:Skp family chaperone for outer membrane proteins